MSLDGDRMLARSCRAMKLGLMESTVAHEVAGMACFNSFQFGKRMVIRWYSSTLMDINLYGDRDLNMR